MNHLHHWIEWAHEREHDWLSVVPGSICFSMPHFDEIRSLKWQPELLRPPFEKCWLEGVGPVSLYSLPEFRHKAGERNSRYELVCFYVADVTDGFAVTSFIHNKDLREHEWLQGYRNLLFDRKQMKWFSQYNETDPQLSNPFRPVQPDGDTMNLYSAYCDWISAFLTLLNCSNVPREQHSPPERLQKARVRRGKLPLFSYWTLDLDVFRTSQGSSQGVTHASPRLHLRRGHTRQHHPGKWCWVQPHAVGNKRLGIVHKDYAMESASLNSVEP